MFSRLVPPVTCQTEAGFTFLLGPEVTEEWHVNGVRRLIEECSVLTPGPLLPALHVGLVQRKVLQFLTTISSDDRK